MNDDSDDRPAWLPQPPARAPRAPASMMKRTTLSLASMLLGILGVILILLSPLALVSGLSGVAWGKRLPAPLAIAGVVALLIAYRCRLRLRDMK
jgi:hypothetical protein